jgi:hypothetical protein
MAKPSKMSRKLVQEVLIAFALLGTNKPSNQLFAFLANASGINEAEVKQIYVDEYQKHQKTEENPLDPVSIVDMG